MKTGKTMGKVSGVIVIQGTPMTMFVEVTSGGFPVGFVIPDEHTKMTDAQAMELADALEGFANSVRKGIKDFIAARVN